MDEQALEYATSYVNGNRNSTCREILAGLNPAIMASMVTLRICREDKDSGMAEEFIRILAISFLLESFTE